MPHKCQTVEILFYPNYSLRNRFKGVIILLLVCLLNLMSFLNFECGLLRRDVAVIRINLSS